MARPTKPFFAPWLEKHITGLCQLPDGRWRINATGERFRAENDREAVAMFFQKTDQPSPGQIFIGETVGTSTQGKTTWDGAVLKRSSAEQRATGVRFSWTSDGTKLNAGVWVPQELLYRWMAKELLKRPEHCARMTGIKALTSLADLPAPVPPLKLKALLQLYCKHADVQRASMRDARKTFEDFLTITKAVTLADLTTETLAAYRDLIRSRVKSPGTMQAYFGRVKWIIAFAKSEGENAAQIDAALSRMAVLKALRDKRVHVPTPISAVQFRALQEAAAKEYPQWQARLLLMLNLCLHFDEALDLEWGDFDLEKGTFCTRRNKRGRVIRAATLWKETLALLSSIRPTGSPYLFVSARGTRFNARGQWKTWHKLRNAAGYPAVQMDDIRDGAYSAACAAPGVDEKFARLLAGHRSHGLQDTYVARNPALVKSACDAVYAAYFGQK